MSSNRIDTTADTLAEPPVLPGLVLIAGSVPLVSPTPKPDLTDDLWAALLLMQDGDADPDEIEAFIAKAEAHMGTTDMHRIDARLAAGLITESEAETERVAIRRRISTDKRRARLDEHQRAARLSEPLRDPVTVAALAELTGDARMKRAEAEALRIAGPKAFRGQIHKAEAEARKLEAKAEELRRAELEQDRLYGEAKEPILMAKARGETILAADIEIATVARDELGARIIHRRGPNKGMPALVYTKATRAKKFTGIEHAYLSGHLAGVIRAPAEALRDTGLEWGRAFIIVTGSTGRGEGGGGFGPKGPQPRMVEAGEARAIMAGTLKREGLTLTRMSQREVELLDQVCGEDKLLRDCCPTRGTIPATQRRLRHGLRTALENMRAAKDRGEVGKAGRQVKRAARQLAEVR